MLMSSRNKLGILMSNEEEEEEEEEENISRFQDDYIQRLVEKLHPYKYFTPSTV